MLRALISQLRLASVRPARLEKKVVSVTFTLLEDVSKHASSFPEDCTIRNFVTGSYAHYTLVFVVYNK